MTSFADLDRYLAIAEKAGQESDEQRRAVLESFQFEVGETRPALDPWSDTYREREVDLYCRIAGCPYEPELHEASEIAVEAAVQSPYPYGTWDPDIVGNQLIAIGFIIRTLSLQNAASVLEYGMGWGNLTLALSRMGYRVTAVDIEPRFVEAVRERARKKDISLEVLVGRFGDIPERGRPYDAVIFYECFHHCLNHVELLRVLRDEISPDGILVFAGEPITVDFPRPWGIRLDGTSLWAIRRNKWLELGFRESYFLHTLQRCGWKATKHICGENDIGTLYIARKI